MHYLRSIITQVHKSAGWYVLMLALSLTFTPTMAQSEVTVQQSVNGQFVRGTNVNQFGEETGVVNITDGTWSVLQTSTLLSVNPRPLWSPDGGEIAIRFVGEYAGVVSFSDNSIVFSTQSIESGLNVPFDVTYPRGWSADGNVLTIQYAAIGGSHYLANIDFGANSVQEIRRWQVDEQVTDMPLPPNATSVHLNGIHQIERNPVFDDWLSMQLDGSGFYSTFDIGEPVNADINVLWNFRTNEYISLDALVPDLSISGSSGDWSRDGNHLILQARSRDLGDPYILVFYFAPDRGAALADWARVDNRSVQHWLDAGDLFFSSIQDYQGGAAYVIGEIVDGEYRETPFFTLNGDQFQFESSGDWYMQASEPERQRLSCLFEWPLVTRFSPGIAAQVVADHDIGLHLRQAPNRFSQQVGLLAESEIVTITGDAACSSGYRWWPVTTSQGLMGWAAEADRSEYFLQIPVMAQ